MTKATPTASCGPNVVGGARAERALADAFAAFEAIEDFERVEKCSPATPGRLAAAIDASQRMTASSLAAVREFSAVYSRLSLSGYMEDAVTKALKKDKSLHMKKLARRLEKFADTPQLEKILAKANVSVDSWRRLVRRLADVDASATLGNGGIQVNVTGEQPRLLVFTGSKPPVNILALAGLTAMEAFAHASSRELATLVAIPVQPRENQEEETLDDAILSLSWGAVHGMHQRRRELEDVGFVVAGGADGGAGAIIIVIGWIILLIGLAVGLAGAIIVGLCAGGTITDETTCDVGEALAIAGAIAIGVGLGTAVIGSFVSSGGTITLRLEVDGREVHRETIEVPPGP